jgi:hypothetical protein
MTRRKGSARGRGSHSATKSLLALLAVAGLVFAHSLATNALGLPDSPNWELILGALAGLGAGMLGVGLLTHAGARRVLAWLRLRASVVRFTSLGLAVAVPVLGVLLSMALLPSQELGVSPSASPRPPRFPWRPPSPSAFYVMRDSDLQPPLKTFGDVAAQLEEMLRTRGYTEYAWYAVPKGFALVTRLERMRDDASSDAPPRRWEPEITAMGIRDFSIASYVWRLTRSEPGRYRVLVFVATPRRVILGGKSPTRLEAERWLGEGLVDGLPNYIGTRPWRGAVTALVYEFVQPAQSEPTKFVEKSTHLGYDHLVHAGILHSS